MRQLRSHWVGRARSRLYSDGSPPRVVAREHQRRVISPPARSPAPIEAEAPHSDRALGQAQRSDEAAQRFLRALGGLNRRLLSATSEEDAFAALAQIGPQLFPGWAGRIVLLDPAQAATSQRAWWRETGGETGERSRALGATPRHRLVAPVTGTASKSAPRSMELQLERTTPLPAPWLCLASWGAQACAAALDLALAALRQRLALQEQALCDELTGLRNRRFFNDALADEVARSQRDGSTLSLALLDIDHFKAFNDRFGHMAGDAVLRSVGAAVRQAVRRSDVACRIGGEEIALLLPHARNEAVTGHLDSLRRRLERLELSFEGRRLPPVTVSIGLAHAQGPAIDAAALMQEADAALYEAKGQGRNRLVERVPAKR